MNPELRVSAQPKSRRYTGEHVPVLGRLFGPVMNNNGAGPEDAVNLVLEKREGIEIVTAHHDFRRCTIPKPALGLPQAVRQFTVQNTDKLRDCSFPPYGPAPALRHDNVGWTDNAPVNSLPVGEVEKIAPAHTERFVIVPVRRCAQQKGRQIEFANAA